jgi:hypothetical protein
LEDSGSNSYAYFLIRNASLAQNSLAFSSSFLGKGTFKKVLVVMMIKCTHFLRHWALVRRVQLVGVADIVELQASSFKLQAFTNTTWVELQRSQAQSFIKVITQSLL